MSTDILHNLTPVKHSTLSEIRLLWDTLARLSHQPALWNCVISSASTGLSHRGGKKPPGAPDFS